jgi:hypothetical protein
MNTTHETPASHIRRGAAAAVLGLAGLLHAFITMEYLKEKAYIGVSFGLSFILCSIVAVWLWKRNDRLAWVAGTLLAGGMLAGFLLSRTIGLPGFDESGVWAHWTEGFPALAAELGFLALAISHFRAPVPAHAVAMAPAGQRDLQSASR